MKLATLRDGSADGRLVVVSRDLRTVAHAGNIVANLRLALEVRDEVAPRLATLYERLNAGGVDGAFEFRAAEAAAPVPRTWQWLDGSAYHSHGDLMERAFKHAPLEGRLTRALMYQGA